MSSLRTRLKTVALLAVPFLAVAVGGGFCQEAAARGSKPLREFQKASNRQLVEALHTLHAVKKTLKMADRDYGGHRARAVHDISAAAHELRLALGTPRKKPARPGKGKPTPPPEPQALSDQQLAAAVPVLKETITFLQNARHDYGGHRTKAIADLGVAIAQLEKALAYSRAHNKNKP